MRTDVQAVLTAIGRAIDEANSGINIQEVSDVEANAGSADGLGGELAGDGLARLAIGLDSGNLNGQLGVAGQAFQLQSVLGSLVTQHIEVGNEVLSQHNLTGSIGYLDIVSVYIVGVRSGGELDGSGSAANIRNLNLSTVSEGGSHSGVGTGSGVGEVSLVQQGQVQSPSILNLNGLVSVSRSILLVGLHTLNVQSLGLAIDLQHQIVLIGVAGSRGADTGLNEDVIVLGGGVLHRRNVDAGEVLLHNGGLVGEIEVRVTGQIDDLGIVTQGLVQSTGSAGAPVRTIGGVGQSLVAHHDDGSIGIGSLGLIQLLNQPIGGLNGVLTVDNVVLGVQTDDVDTVDNLVEVGLVLTESGQVSVQNLVIGLITEVNALELVVTGDGQLLDVGAAHNLVPNGVELSILLSNTGVNQVAGEQNGRNTLLLHGLQSSLQSIVGSGSAGLQVDVGHNADLLRLIGSQRGIQLSLLVLVGVSSQNGGGNSNLDGLDGQLHTGGEQTDSAGLAQVSGIPLSGVNAHLITLQSRIILQEEGLPPSAAVAGAHIAAELGLLEGLVSIQIVVGAGVGDLPSHVVTLTLPVGIDRSGRSEPGAGLGALGGIGAGPVGTAPSAGRTDGEGQLSIGFVGCIIDASQRGQTHTVATGGSTTDEDAVTGLGVSGSQLAGTTSDDTAGTHVGVDPSLSHVYSDLVVREGIQELGQVNVVVVVVGAVTNVQLAILNLSVVDVVGEVGLSSLVSDNVFVEDFGPALGQLAVLDLFEILLVQNILGLVSVLGDHVDSAFVTVSIHHIQSEDTLSGNVQDAAANADSRIRCGPDNILTGHSNTVDNNGNVLQRDLLIDVDEQIAVVLGDGEILAVSRGRNAHNCKRGNTQRQATNHCQDLFHCVFHAVHTFLKN